MLLGSAVDKRHQHGCAQEREHVRPRVPVDAADRHDEKQSDERSCGPDTAPHECTRNDRVREAVHGSGEHDESGEPGRANAERSEHFAQPLVRDEVRAGLCKRKWVAVKKSRPEDRLADPDMAPRVTVG